MATEVANSTEILQELKSIKSELQYLKEHMVSSDMILTKEEEILLSKAREEHKNKKTTKLKDLMRDLN